MERTIKIKLSFAELDITAIPLGEDLQIVASGGDRPHIGCCVLAVPRPSLAGNGKTSCTSSVLNLTGHKDEALCRLLAEKAAVKTKRTVVCTGGFHVEQITQEQISELLEAVQNLNFESL